MPSKAFHDQVGIVIRNSRPNKPIGKVLLNSGVSTDPMTPILIPRVLKRDPSIWTHWDRFLIWKPSAVSESVDSSRDSEPVCFGLGLWTAVGHVGTRTAFVAMRSVMSTAVPPSAPGDEYPVPLSDRAIGVRLAERLCGVRRVIW